MSNYEARKVRVGTRSVWRIWNKALNNWNSLHEFATKKTVEKAIEKLEEE